MPKTGSEKKRTTIYLTEDLLWRLREIAAKRRISSDTKAIETAVREWVEAYEDAPKPLPIDHKKIRGTR